MFIFCLALALNLPIATFAWQNMIVPALIPLICTGVGEELIFRGVIQRTSMQIWGYLVTTRRPLGHNGG